MLTFSKGSNNNVSLKDTWAYDMDTNHWQEFRTTGKGPSPRYSHTASVLASNLILVFGGHDGHHFFNDLYILDLTTRAWSPVEPNSEIVPPPRYAHSMNIVGRQLLIFGGSGSDGVAYNDLWIFDFETLLWLRPALAGVPPEPRSYHSASLVGDKILVFGGKWQKTWYNDVVILDIPSRTWVPLALAPPTEGQALAPRGYHTATVVNDNLICILGGSGGTRMTKELLLFDLADMRWYIYGKMDVVRCKHTTNVMKNQLVAVGGHDGTGFSNSFARLEIEHLFQFLSANAPRPSEAAAAAATAGTFQIQPMPQVAIDKENALVYNTEGAHVQPHLLEAHVDDLAKSLDLVTQHMQLMDDDVLQYFLAQVETVFAKVKAETEVRAMHSKRKKAKKGVKWGEIAVREHKRAVGHDAVPSDGGPALGMDSKYAAGLLRRLSSYENLREAVRVGRQEYMKAGHVAPKDREKLLIEAGSSRPVIWDNIQETAAVKKTRAEAAQCPQAVIISEAGLLPTNGNIKFRPSETMK